jgi:Polysaccharide deacetylase
MASPLSPPLGLNPPYTGWAAVFVTGRFGDIVLPTIHKIAGHIEGQASKLIVHISAEIGALHRGDRTRQALALTFDDGPSESTPRLLELLGRHSIRATFFMCGQNMRRCPAIARAVVAQGHEIGNHTDSHPSLLFDPPGSLNGKSRWLRKPFSLLRAWHRDCSALLLASAGMVSGVFSIVSASWA